MEHDFGRLFVQHHQRVYGYVRALVMNRHDAEEILQDTFSILWRKFDEFEPGTNFLAWALSVARFRVREFQRRQRSVLPLDDTLLEALAADTVALSSGMLDLREALAHCLAKLKPHDLELFRKRYAGETSVLELADGMGRPASTIYSALTRIRRQLLACVSQRLELEFGP